MEDQHEILFYDIASGPPVRPFAVNPCKTRYALNFKKVSYKTELVELPDVKNVRKSLECAPVRKHMDGSDFYTLPIVKNTKTGEIVGDSFDIALYLDRTFQTGPRLMAAGTEGLTAAFNAQVDALWVQIVRLGMRNFPFNPANGHIYKAEACARFGAESWEAMDTQTEEERVKILKDGEAALEPLAKWYRMDESGPFLAGAQVAYADIAVGGWLLMYSVTFPRRSLRRSWPGTVGCGGGYTRRWRSIGKLKCWRVSYRKLLDKRGRKKKGG
ncbi:hypothetical protein MCOR02_005757 [Pyricularia oryzae]|nr:hypothetical protein MCOR02_005757 [Pyricularia oryzae]